MNYLIIDRIIEQALLEDRAFEDITTLNITKKDSICSVEVIAKEDGIICGLEVFIRVFEKFGGVEVELLKADGDNVDKKELVARVKGNTRSILSGERLALNLLQRMSGIASETKKVVDIFSSYNIKVMDTRKTTPNLRYLEKYSVRIGGGYNHRYDLADMAMVKDNHILAAGGIRKAVEAVRRAHPFIKKIEVEVEDLIGVREAIDLGVDIIMLDNMSREMMLEAIGLIGSKAVIEASGNIDSRIEDIRGLKIDYVSMGRLTHSVRSLDISMKNLKLL